MSWSYARCPFAAAVLFMRAAYAQGAAGSPDWIIERDTRLLADLNGDGKADIVGFGEAGVWTALTIGDGTFAAGLLVIPEFGADHGWTAAVHVRLLADINRDGNADIVAFGEQGRVDGPREGGRLSTEQRSTIEEIARTAPSLTLHLLPPRQSGHNTSGRAPSSRRLSTGARTFWRGGRKGTTRPESFSRPLREYQQCPRRSS